MTEGVAVGVRSDVGEFEGSKVGALLGSGVGTLGSDVGTLGSDVGTLESSAVGVLEVGVPEVGVSEDGAMVGSEVGEAPKTSDVGVGVG